VAAPSVRAIIEQMVTLYGIEPVDPAAAAKLLAAAPPSSSAPPSSAPTSSAPTSAGAPSIGQLVDAATGSTAAAAKPGGR
jgi:hypothetical protein